MIYKRKFFLKVFLLVIFTFFYCEYIIYFLVIKQCSWPEIRRGSNDSLIKSMLIADTHLLGPYRGHWFDKLRREWQMQRSFQTAVSLLQPDVIFVLGDLFDEGKWSNRDEIEEYINRFFYLFKVPEGMQLYAVPGNHDIGFHYALRPFILDKFNQSFNISDVQLLNLKGNYFILINSMAMEGDGCYLCSEAEKKIRKIAAKLKCIKNGYCAKANINDKYSRPVILQHFPMYRKSDSECNDTDSAPEHLKSALFKEKWDCLSKKASEMIYRELNPRAIFTGHVHHGCHLVHKNDIHEFTISSFSWRNKNNPSFLLATITQDYYVISKCHLPREYTVIGIYCSVITASLMWFFYKKKHLNFLRIKQIYFCKDILCKLYRNY